MNASMSYQTTVGAICNREFGVGLHLWELGPPSEFGVGLHNSGGSPRSYLEFDSGGIS
jgi:hypothetical protein